MMSMTTLRTATTPSALARHDRARPYHHGNLREALLDAPPSSALERGRRSLSLRELAREVGVSHAAPRRHFADKQALLDALAQAASSGSARRCAAAVAGAGPDFDARLLGARPRLRPLRHRARRRCSS